MRQQPRLYLYVQAMDILHVELKKAVCMLNSDILGRI